MDNSNISFLSLFAKNSEDIELCPVDKLKVNIYKYIINNKKCTYRFHTNVLFVKILVNIMKRIINAI